MTLRNKRISAHVTEEDSRELKAILAREGKSISDWLRERMHMKIAIHRKFEEKEKEQQHEPNTTD